MNVQTGIYFFKQVICRCWKPSLQKSIVEIFWEENVHKHLFKNCENLIIIFLFERVYDANPLKKISIYNKYSRHPYACDYLFKSPLINFIIAIEELPHNLLIVEDRQKLIKILPPKTTYWFLRNIFPSGFSFVCVRASGNEFIKI